ncbi:hypothetical protein XarbCFBP8150_21460, partial [Xanthomonas arboricola]
MRARRRIDALVRTAQCRLRAEAGEKGLVMEDIQEERTRLSRAQATLRSAHEGIDAAPRPHASARAST